MGRDHIPHPKTLNAKPKGCTSKPGRPLCYRGWQDQMERNPPWPHFDPPVGLAPWLGTSPRSPALPPACFCVVSSAAFPPLLLSTVSFLAPGASLQAVAFILLTQQKSSDQQTDYSALLYL